MITKYNYEKRWYLCMDANNNEFICWPNAGKLYSVIPQVDNPFEFDHFISIIESYRHPLDEISKK